MKASDNPYPSLLLVEGAAPSTPAAGHARLFVDSTDGLLKYVDDAGVVTEVGGAGGGGAGPTYSTYAPALTATTTNPTMGTGSTSHGRYFQDGKHVVGDLAISFGSSGVNAGSGSYRISLPVTARTPTSVEGYMKGSGYIYDASTFARTPVFASHVSTTTVELNTSSNQIVQHTVPWTWAAGDILLLHLDYEAA